RGRRNVPNLIDTVVLSLGKGHIEDALWNVVTNPIVHDSVGVLCLEAGINIGAGYGPDRSITYMNGASRQQSAWKSADLSGMVPSLMEQLADKRFIESGKKKKDATEDRTMVGAINIEQDGYLGYQSWLEENYGISIVINFSDLGKRVWQD